MKRRLFTIVSVLSLVLCVATLVLWVRSYWFQSDIGLWVPALRQSLGLIANDGKLIALNHAYSVAVSPKIPFHIGFNERAEPRTSRAEDWVESGYYAYDGFGFGVGYPGSVSASATSSPVGLRRYVLVAPLWFITALFALLPTVKLRSMLRRRPKPGCCPSCGYDMRATPDRCPECGTSPASSPVGHC